MLQKYKHTHKQTCTHTQTNTNWKTIYQCYAPLTSFKCIELMYYLVLGCFSAKKNTTITLRVCTSSCKHFTTYHRQSRSTHNDGYKWFLKFDYKTRVGETFKITLHKAMLSCEKNDAISPDVYQNNTLLG